MNQIEELQKENEELRTQVEKLQSKLIANQAENHELRTHIENIMGIVRQFSDKKTPEEILRPIEVCNPREW